MDISELINLVRSINTNHDNPYYIKLEISHNVIKIDPYGSPRLMFKADKEGIKEMISTLQYIDEIR